MWLVVGLGNPGDEYTHTRHNAGFMVVAELFGRARASTPKTKFGAEICEGSLGGQRTILCRPQEFMNTSGLALAKVAAFWKIEVDHILVVHDDLDLPFGGIKLSLGGGHGGHNGLRSIISTCGADFARVRVGIGRPTAGWNPADYVLARFLAEENRALSEIIGRAADAAQAVLARGISVAMNTFNTKKSNPAQNS